MKKHQLMSLVESLFTIILIIFYALFSFILLVFISNKISIEKLLIYLYMDEKS